MFFKKKLYIIYLDKQYLGYIGDWEFYKVKVPRNNAMYSSTIKTACEKEGLVATCITDNSNYKCRQYSRSGCTVTSLNDCTTSSQHFLGNFSRSIGCTYRSSDCPRLFGVWAYINSSWTDYVDRNDRSCGIERYRYDEGLYGNGGERGPDGGYGKFSCAGSAVYDESALCARRKGNM